MPGSMPSFSFLTEEERNLLAEHVWSLAGLDAKKPGKVASQVEAVRAFIWKTSVETLARNESTAK